MNSRSSDLWILFAVAFFAVLPSGLYHGLQAVELDEPIILEQAERMSGTREGRHVVVEGNVRFRHGELVLETQRAVWDRAARLVHCEQGLVVQHNGALLRSERGSYSKTSNVATAMGNVFARDSSGEVELRGGRLEYDRVRQKFHVFLQPELRRYYPDTTMTDSSDGSAMERVDWVDTLVIRGRTLSYDDSTDVARAESEVEIHKGELAIRCEKAIFHQRKELLVLEGNPKARLGDNLVTGTLIEARMRGEVIDALMVGGKASVEYREEPTDSTSERLSHLSGDSLFMAFRDGGLDSMEVFRNAVADYYDIDRPERKNDLEGGYIKVFFEDKKMKLAHVFGDAKTTYHHYEKKSYRGRNVSEGDSLDIWFREGRIDEIFIRGNAKGIFFARNLEPREESEAASPGEAEEDIEANVESN